MHLALNLSNPFQNRFSSVFCKTWSLPIPNKYFELVCLKTNTLIAFAISIQFNGDHPGIHVAGGLIGYEVHFNLYDGYHLDEL